LLVSITENGMGSIDVNGVLALPEFRNPDM
jgi:hypothetical protein